MENMLSNFHQLLNIQKYLSVYCILVSPHFRISVANWTVHAFQHSSPPSDNILYYTRSSEATYSYSLTRLWQMFYCNTESTLYITLYTCISHIIKNIFYTSFPFFRNYLTLFFQLLRYCFILYANSIGPLPIFLRAFITEKCNILFYRNCQTAETTGISQTKHMQLDPFINIRLQHFRDTDRSDKMRHLVKIHFLIPLFITDFFTAK